MTSALEREQHFHDDRFGGEDPRRALSFAYAGGFPAMDAFNLRLSLLLSQSSRALEIGCGNKPLSAAAGTAVGIDISLEAAVRANCVDRPIVVGDASCLPFESESMDLVHGRSILHHLPVEQAVEEAARVLAPGGRLLFVEPLGHNPFLRAFRRLTPGMRTPDEHPLLRRDLELVERYFATGSAQWFDLAGLLAVPISNRRFGRSARRTLNRLDVRVGRRWPLVGSYGWWVVWEGWKPLRRPGERRNG
jgi:SAM-dependent methyltransferase